MVEGLAIAMLQIHGTTSIHAAARPTQQATPINRHGLDVHHDYGLAEVDCPWNASGKASWTRRVHSRSKDAGERPELINHPPRLRKLQPVSTCSTVHSSNMGYDMIKHYVLVTFDHTNSFGLQMSSDPQLSLIHI